MSKHKRIFEINPYGDKIRRLTKRNVHAAATTQEKAI